ncbi:MAG: hypothetical protein PHY85_02185, partial [Bacteroidales bacterium]|nr:hypothetical protein [Bacteroidales bacterium]
YALIIIRKICSQRQRLPEVNWPFTTANQKWPQISRLCVRLPFDKVAERSELISFDRKSCLRRVVVLWRAKHVIPHGAEPVPDRAPVLLEWRRTIICPPSSGQNFDPSVYSFPHFTQRGISFSGDTNFAPSSLQNFVPVGKILPHFGQVGVSIISISRLQPQFWQNFVPNSNSALHFGHLYIVVIFFVNGFICIHNSTSY